ncbi:unnamed protein product [Euphydryas editha]|uniref:Phorbol-ester/DAG-type domain-containing protein n=1 Tax=Euphydryas editha TaxID=104508 RepID=A0AAU9TF55_EUPED|nr:unnamed protein product [Euphydryas editha]
MASKCNQCGKFLSPIDGAKCNKCASVFHRTCVNLSPDSRPPTRWMCRSCCGYDSKGKSTTVTETPTSEELYEDANTQDNMEKSSTALLAEEMRLLRSEIVTVTREMASFRLELGRLNENVAEFNKRVETVEERLTSLEEKFTNKVNCEQDTSQINDVIEQLKEDINEREQMLLLNDIQIAGVPERNGENVLHLTQAISSKLGITLESRDIVSAERAGSRRFPPGGEERHRPRPVIVRLARRALRDEIIKSARVRRNTDTSDVIDGDPSRVYINEHLTRDNRLLFYKAREEGKRHGWRYTWTRDGRIYMRREMGSAVQRIRKEKDIFKIFGTV